MSKTPNITWPVWQVGAIWKRKQGPWPGSDHLGPFTYEFAWPVRPTPDVITTQMRLPAGIEGTWACGALAWVIQVQPGADVPAEGPGFPEKN